MESKRDLRKRINQGILITGATGSGKSRMTERLAAVWPRVLYVDPMGGFQAEDIVRTSSFTETTKQLSKVWGSSSWRIAATYTSDDQYCQIWKGLAALALQTHGTAPAMCLVIDEVDLWSSPRHIDPDLRRLLRYGRHYGMSWVANCRADVDTNRAVRMNATEILLFRQGMLSPEMQRMVKSTSRLRGSADQGDFLVAAQPVGLTDVARLRRHDTPGQAVEGEHFIAVPDPFDEWFKGWTALAQEDGKVGG